MKNFIAAAFMALTVASCGTAPAYAEDMTRQERVTFLSSSVGRLVENGANICTVSKIDQKRFLTARHCVTSFPNAQLVVEYEQVPNEGSYYAKQSAIVTSIHIGGRKKEGGKDDWAVLYTSTTIENMNPIPFECTQTVKVGQSLASMGYPAPLGRFYSEGYVASVEPTNFYSAGSDFWMVLRAGPGSSGGPIINLEGKAVGVLVEGYPVATGAQAVNVKDLCDVYSR